MKNLNQMINFTTSLGLSQLVRNPTRTTETSSSLIDHIYTNCEENISRVHVGNFSLSDHFNAIFGNRKLNVQIKNKEYHIFDEIVRLKTNLTWN